jgi:hypothetical protein
MGRDFPQDQRVAAIASRQHGNVTRQQLLDAGFSDNAIAHRVRCGWLHRVHIGVYAVGRPPRTALERASAAVLACGPSAALSHMSALCLWGLAKRWPTVMDVTVTGDRRRPGINVRRDRELPARDRRRHQGIPVTSPARTLLDCAPALTAKALTRAVNDGLRSRYLRPADLTDVTQRFPHHPGTRLLMPFVTTPTGPTRSEFEDGFLEFCRRYGLPRPLVNTRVAGHEADAVFSAEGLIVELDSWEFHSDRTAFESDRDRDADTLAADFGTVRITWERIEDEPTREAERLRTILERRRASAGATLPPP